MAVLVAVVRRVSEVRASLGSRRRRRYCKLVSPMVPVASYDGGGKSWLATEVRRRSLARGRREPRSTREKKRMKSKRRHEHRQLRRRWPRRQRLRSCRRASQGLRLCWWCREEEAAGRASTLVRVGIWVCIILPSHTHIVHYMSGALHPEPQLEFVCFVGTLASCCLPTVVGNARKWAIALVTLIFRSKASPKLDVVLWVTTGEGERALEARNYRERESYNWLWLMSQVMRATVRSECKTSGLAPSGLLVPLGNTINREDLCIAWRLAARVSSAKRCLKYSGVGRALAPGGGQVLPGGLDLYCLAVLGAAPGDCTAGWWLTCDDMSKEVHIQLLSRGDTSEVRRAGLQAGRIVEQDYERGGYKALGLRSWPRTNSPFMFVYGDDRVIRYTGADVDTGDVEDVQATEVLDLVHSQVHSTIFYSSLSRLGETCRNKSVHIRALAQAESSCLSVAMSRSGERGLPNRDRVGPWLVAIVSGQVRGLTFGRGVIPLRRGGLASARTHVISDPHCWSSRLSESLSFEPKDPFA
ncbi:hypothetical protein DEO72_LG8g2239 [Vigna unguiculata]|uniref:Uncharacterized protein n=1 Tax=Vigna unguiculata TaxID=3917 RepID=A0A4D6MRY3_VIGUN|nr:hypothetical protein DEO72_LG8g2239 [Vigna unguiculata]